MKRFIEGEDRRQVTLLPESSALPDSMRLRSVPRKLGFLTANKVDFLSVNGRNGELRMVCRTRTATATDQA